MNIVEYYDKNITAIYQRVISLYNKGQPAYEYKVEVPKLSLIPVPKDKKGKVRLNRAVYLWMKKVIRQLEAVINELVSIYNDMEIIDFDVGNTPEIKLWVPDRLAIDDIYIAKLSDNFEECNKVLDNLEKYLQPYLAVE